mmetsp:Transcript_22230/g.58890  ORF Transcript_22230/g.58890 Transcript_22230/m.58890 type:complete len:236 (+) Transcript_22230:1546-2253(+)
MKFLVLLHSVQHTHVPSEPRLPTAACVRFSSSGIGMFCRWSGVLSQELVGEIPLNGHDVSAGAGQVKLELVLLYVADARPERQLTVAVERTRSLHPEGFDAVPNVTHVVHLRSSQTLDVDVEQTAGGQHCRVATTPEGHIHDFVWQENCGIHPQLRFHHLGIDGPRIAHKEVRKGRHAPVHPLRCWWHRDLCVLRIKNLLVDELLQCEQVHTTILFERHHCARRGHRVPPSEGTV